MQVHFQIHLNIFYESFKQNFDHIIYFDDQAYASKRAVIIADRLLTGHK
jgi:hypothetical protein